MLHTTVTEESTLLHGIVTTLFTSAAAAVGYITKTGGHDMVIVNAVYVATAVSWFALIVRLHENRLARARSEENILVLAAIQHSRVVGYTSVVQEAERFLGGSDE